MSNADAAIPMIVNHLIELRSGFRNLLLNCERSNCWLLMVDETSRLSFGSDYNFSQKLDWASKPKKISNSQNVETLYQEAVLVRD